MEPLVLFLGRPRRAEPDLLENINKLGYLYRLAPADIFFLKSTYPSEIGIIRFIYPYEAFKRYREVYVAII